MKNRNKWMIGGMLLAALGIGSFFTQQTAVTAAEINIPYTDSNQGFTTGMDGTSLCLNLRNANNCICEDIPQDVACSGYLSVTFSIHGIGTDAYRLQKDGTQGTPYFAELVGVVRSVQDEEILRFCNGEEDDFAPGTVAIMGDGTYTVRTELTQDADQILSLAVNTNIDLYRYQEEGNLAKSGITMQVESVTTQQETATKQAIAKQETPIFAQDFNTTMPMTTTQRATTTTATTPYWHGTTTSTTPYWYGTTTSDTPYWYWTTTRTEITTTWMWRSTTRTAATTSKKSTSSRGYYLSALDQSNTIGLGEQLQLFVGNDGSYAVSSSNHQDIIPAWVSFQPDVATVDDTGLVTAVSEGKAVIAAEINNTAISIEITVAAPTTTTITTEDLTWGTTTKPSAVNVSVRAPQIVTINNIKRIPKEQAQLQLYLLNQPKDSDVVWSSFYPTIASVDQNGLVTGLSEGKAVIGAMIDGEVYAITLYVVGEEATTTAKSSSTVTTGTETIKGDINGDGVVGVDDAVILLQYYAKQAAGLNPKWEDLK
ncbi:MAG: Ig-like domain-containing protein [Ruminococcus sp.]|nr:Ig-like domain-containing protein [Ruminococcus sp.]